jgi:hypothetical protein
MTRRLARRLHTRERWRAPVMAFVLAALLVLGSTGFLSTAPAATLRLGSANLTGFLIAQQYSAHEPRALTVMDLRTGRWRPRWTAENPASQLADSYGHPTAPAYSAASGQLAFIFQTSDHNRIWRISLRTGLDGRPTADETTLLLEDCAGCSTLSWSPSGRWLVYDAADGLLAINPSTGEQQHITAMSQDGWPACAPDGRWLAYQRASDALANIAVLPTVDCLPVSESGRAPAYIEGCRPSWQPRWSPDRRDLAFTSNMLGVGHVDVTTVAALLPTANAGVSAATLVSPARCGVPVWAARAAGTDAAVISSCDAPGSADRHGTLVLASERAPLAWQIRVGEGMHVRVTPCWVPAPFLGPVVREAFAPDARLSAPALLPLSFTAR